MGGNNHSAEIPVAQETAQDTTTANAETAENLVAENESTTEQNETVAEVSSQEEAKA